MAPDAIGIFTRVDGTMMHFVRNLDARLEASTALEGAVLFSAIGWKEQGACGQGNLWLQISSEDGTFALGPYGCDGAGPHDATGTSLASVGGFYGASYFGGGGCTIVLEEFGSGPGAVVAGTFTGTLGADGSEHTVADGRFRVTLTP